MRLGVFAGYSDVNMYKANRDGNHSLIGMFSFSDLGNNRQPQMIRQHQRELKPAAHSECSYIDCGTNMALHCKHKLMCTKKPLSLHPFVWL